MLPVFMRLAVRSSTVLPYTAVRADAARFYRVRYATLYYAAPPPLLGLG